MKHENAQQRSKGDIGGPALPMNDAANHAEHMDKSLGEASASDLSHGYCAKGSLKGATKSSPGQGD